MGRLALRASTLLIVSAVELLTGGRLFADNHVLRSPRREGELTRVRVSIRVGGDLLLQNDGKTRSVPMSVEARLDYDECLTAERQSAKECRRSYRYYDVAEATIKLEKGQEKPAAPRHPAPDCRASRR